MTQNTLLFLSVNRTALIKFISFDHAAQHVGAMEADGANENSLSSELLELLYSCTDSTQCQYSKESMAQGMLWK